MPKPLPSLQEQFGVIIAMARPPVDSHFGAAQSRTVPRSWESWRNVVCEIGCSHSYKCPL